MAFWGYVLACVMILWFYQNLKSSSPMKTSIDNKNSSLFFLFMTSKIFFLKFITHKKPVKFINKKIIFSKVLMIESSIFSSFLGMDKITRVY